MLEPVGQLWCPCMSAPSLLRLVSVDMLSGKEAAPIRVLVNRWLVDDTH